MALPLIGGQTGIFFELGGKVRKIIKAHLGSYFADGVSFITQQQLSFLHSQVGQVVLDRQTISVFEYAVGVIRRQVNGMDISDVVINFHQKEGHENGCKR